MTAPAERWDDLARSAARGSARREEVSLLHELLVVRLDGDPYAIPIERVREIVRWRAVTTVPRVPPEILGVISLRGEVVQVLDLRKRLGAPAADAERATRVVLHGDDGETTGLRVDGVVEVLRIDESKVHPPASGDSPYVQSLCERGDRFVSLMNLDRILDLGRD